MKTRLLNILTVVILLSIPALNFAQAPTLGTTAEFVLFSSVGAVSNTGISQLTGNVGTNSGSSTGFGNVNGVMHDNDVASAQCSADLLIAYNQLNGTIPTYFPAALLGNGQILNAGVYSIPSPATLNLGLTLDAQGNSNAVFIFQIQGAFSTGANSKIYLINGALACNVFWKVEGLVSMASGTTMRGTVIANNAAIIMNTGDTLEGRALSTTGAVTVSGTLAYTPIGCGSAVLTGPVAPSLASTACYALFSSNGPVSNAGITHVVGDIGTNVGLTTGFNALFVTGAIHPIPDGSTAQCATDLLSVYTYLNALPYDIELLYPAQFGNNLVLTPHTYLMNAATAFTDSLYLNAGGFANAVFVIKIYGALSTSTYSKVILINGAQAKNVYWLVSGAVSINDYSVFEGTIICNNGAVDLTTGVTLNGRALTTTGALSTAAITVTIPPGCVNTSSPIITIEPSDQTVCGGSAVSFSVSATGTGLTYQWRKGVVNLTNVGNITGATTATLTISSVSILDAATDYNVVINGTYLPSATSVNVSLTVNTSPEITAQPLNQVAGVGNSVSFSVTATGSGLTYQWRKGVINLINGGNISGATTATLTINPVNVTDASTNYNVVISGTCSPITNSSNAILTVNTAPNIITGPSDQTACTGGSVSFSVAATGSGLTFQWRKGTVNLTDVGNIVGATTATMIIISVSIYDAATDYNVVINGTYLPSATSANVSLTVNTSPNITAQPASQTAYSGNLVSFSVTATGTGLSYQWRKGNVNLINGGNISGATSATLNFNPVVLADAAPDYNVLVTGACPPISTSVNTSLIVCCPTAIDTIIAGNPDKIVNIYPNPFSTTVNIVLNSEFQNDKLEFRMYNVLGVEEMHTRLTKKITTLETGDLHSGIYFYIIYRNNKSIQTGRLVSQF